MLRRMKNIKKMLFVMMLVMAMAFSPFSAQAHQPRTTGQGDGHQDDPIIVPEPDVSKAYYKELAGEPEYYSISSDVAFALYINILVPDIPSEREHRFSVEVTDAKGGRIALLDGTTGEWKQFYEPFGGDNYLMGPEYRANVSAGQYTLKVFSADNDGKYALAVGEKEAFPPAEILNALLLVPQIKQSFFGVPFPMSLISSPMVNGILVMIVGVIVIALFLFFKFFRKKKKPA